MLLGKWNNKKRILFSAWVILSTLPITAFAIERKVETQLLDLRESFINAIKDVEPNHPNADLIHDCFMAIHFEWQEKYLDILEQTKLDIGVLKSSLSKYGSHMKSTQLEWVTQMAGRPSLENKLRLVLSELRKKGIMPDGPDKRPMNLENPLLEDERACFVACVSKEFTNRMLPMPAADFKAMERASKSFKKQVIWEQSPAGGVVAKWTE